MQAGKNALDIRKKVGQDGDHITFCRLCEALCGMVATVENGKIKKVGPDRKHVVSEGHICIKGPGMLSVTYDPDRVLSPLRRNRDTGEFDPVSWDEALSDIASRLATIIDKYGAEAIGGFFGNPAAFGSYHYAYFTLFMKTIAPLSKLFTNVHNDTGAKSLAMEMLYGNPVVFTFPDLEDCDFLIMIGANPMVSHMSLISEPKALEKLQKIHDRDGVVVIDPRRTESAKRFEHVSVLPDSDAWLLGAMINHNFAKNLDQCASLSEKIIGWDALKKALADITPELAEKYCGVEATTMRSLAERFAKARTSACYGRTGTCRGRFSTLVNMLIEALNIICGRFGRSGGWVTGAPPVGDPEADVAYPAYAEQTSRIGDIPSLLGFVPGGSIADEIMTEGPGQLRAFFIDSGNPVMSYPEGDKLIEAFGQLELLVAVDFYVTESTRHADYILPSTTFFEREDFTEYWVANAPRPWVQHTPAIIKPVGESRLELDIYNDLLERLGLPFCFSDMAPGDSHPPTVMDVVDATLRVGVYGDKFGENPNGLTVERLKENHPHGYKVRERVDAQASWSRIRTEDGLIHLDTPMLYEEIDRLKLEGKAADDQTLLLFGRRKLGSLNSWMHNVDRLVRREKPTLLMHPQDAKVRQITDGSQVKVTSSAGSLDLEVEITEDVKIGSVSYPHGWGHEGGWQRANQTPGANINLLTSSDPKNWEQVSGMVHMDGIPVMVSALV